MLNRPRLLQGSTLAFAGFGRAGFAQEQPAVPVVFVRADSDLGAHLGDADLAVREQRLSSRKPA